MKQSDGSCPRSVRWQAGLPLLGSARNASCRRCRSGVSGGTCECTFEAREEADDVGCFEDPIALSADVTLAQDASCFETVDGVADGTDCVFLEDEFKARRDDVLFEERMVRRSTSGVGVPLAERVLVV